VLEIKARTILSGNVIVGNRLNMATNITWHHSHLTREDRESLLNQRGVTLWFTGLSGAGKSTIATALERELFTNKKSTYILDGDNIRHGLCSDLGFGPEDRQENIRRIGEVCNLFTDAGIIVLAAFVSPYKADRDNVRQLLDKNPSPRDDDDETNPNTRGKNFIEVYVQADVETCILRDPKGLYKKAKAGEIKNFTGISAPFEAPENPELVLRTGEKSLDECVSELINYLREGGYIS
jgi:adenylylsulfate kinase